MGIGGSREMREAEEAGELERWATGSSNGYGYNTKHTIAKSKT